MNEEKTFYDSFSNRYFVSSFEKLLAVERELSDKIVTDHVLDLNAFYSKIGIEELQIGEILKCQNWKNEIDYIEMNHTKTILDDGMNIYILSFRFWPLGCWLNDI